MVAPTSSPIGQNVLIMPVGNNDESATTVAKKIFRTMGMNSEDFDFDKHADAMVILQMVPHLIQRILIDALSQGISQKSMSIEDLSRLASANYLLTELGLGRVATQRPSVSAGIIATALKENFGRKILGGIQSTLGKIISAGEDREELTNLFQASVTNQIDSDILDWFKAEGNDYQKYLIKYYVIILKCVMLTKKDNKN